MAQKCGPLGPIFYTYKSTSNELVNEILSESSKKKKK